MALHKRSVFNAACPLRGGQGMSLCKIIKGEQAATIPRELRQHVQR